MTKNNNGITEIVFILDRSGSMAGLESDTIGGFNAMIEKQKKQEGECLVTTVLFSSESLTLHDRLPLKSIAPLTEKDYCVGGCTALIDAIGGTVDHIKRVRRYIRPEDVPANTMFVITTDGLENASREYSSDRVKKMIEAQKEEGWEFIFIGANIDAYAEAQRYGIRKERAVNYVCDDRGTAHVYAGVSKAVCSVMMAESLVEVEGCLDRSDWDKDINADFQRRGAKRNGRRA